MSFGDDLFLRGTCSLFPTPGSHGNLGELLASHGPRQLRVDAKTALSVLPPLAGKGFKEALEILRRQRPTRVPEAWLAVGEQQPKR